MNLKKKQSNFKTMINSISPTAIIVTLIILIGIGCVVGMTIDMEITSAWMVSALMSATGSFVGIIIVKLIVSIIENKRNGNRLWKRNLILLIYSIAHISIIVIGLCLDAIIFCCVAVSFILASTILAIVGFFVQVIVSSIKDNIILSRNMTKFPISKDEFEELTKNMNLLECIKWLDSFVGIDESYYHGLYSNKQYSGYILQFYYFAYEKYKNAGINHGIIPSILWEDFKPVNFSDINISVSYDFLSEDLSDLKVIEAKLMNLIDDEEDKEKDNED